MRVRDLRLLPDDPEAWMRAVAGPIAEREETVTADGWPAILVRVGDRLHGFYRFYSHVGWAVADASDAGRAELLSARPDFDPELIALRDLWG